MNAEQAQKIHDIESYIAVTGAKRFKRTKEEMSLGLSPEEALKRRIQQLETGLSNESFKSLERGLDDAKNGRTAPLRETSKHSTKSGDLIIRPEKGVSSDYFEHMPDTILEIRLDSQWYGWWDTLMSGPFDGNAQKLIQYIMNFGIGEVHTKFHFPADIAEYERPVKTPNTLL